MAQLSLAGVVMVVETAFEGLETGAEKLAEIVGEEGAAAGSVNLTGEIQLTAFESGGEDSERTFRGHFQHHPVAVAGAESFGSFFNSPPARAHAEVDTNFAGAWHGRRIFLGDGFYRLCFGYGNRAHFIRLAAIRWKNTANNPNEYTRYTSRTKKHVTIWIKYHASFSCQV
jgi:hypothetical protein